MFSDMSLNLCFFNEEKKVKNEDKLFGDTFILFFVLPLLSHIFY